MAFKVVATPFRSRVETAFQYEHEALRPLGITITTVQAERRGLRGGSEGCRRNHAWWPHAQRRVVAWDPFVDDSAFTQHRVERVTELADLFRRSDLRNCFIESDLCEKGKERGW